MTNHAAPLRPAGPRSRSRIARLLAFPDPVDEVSARLVAGGVVLLCVAVIAVDQPWGIAAIAYGFVARVLAGPTLSPLGLLVTRALRPRLRVAPRHVPGPPKRFAQGMGAAMSTLAAVLALAAGQEAVGYALLGLLALAAALEATLAFCLGCRIFALLMRVGVIPERVCARCADLRLG